VVDTCPICHDSSEHKLGAYLKKFDSLAPSDHRSVDDKLNCGSDESPRKCVVAPKSERQIGALSQR
jgi:hypothetical protein